MKRAPRHTHLGLFTVLLLLVVLAFPATASAVPWTAEFGPPSTVSIGAGVWDVDAGDLNGDGFPDLVTADYSRPTVSVLLNDGSGGYSPPTVIGIPGDQPQSVVAGDFDRDGDLDVAVACYASAAVVVLFGDGVGGLSVAGSVGVPGLPNVLATGDFNGDGALDIVASLWGSDTVSVLQNDSTGGFSVASVTGAGTNPTGLAVADFNHDGDCDVAVAAQSDSTIRVFAGNGTGALGLAGIFGMPGRPVDLVAGDWNDDGFDDLAATTVSGSGLVTLTGVGGFTFFVSNVYSLTATSFGLAAGDIDCDGKDDLAVTDYAGNGVFVLTGDGAGFFGVADLEVTAPGPVGVTLSDVDVDGRLDLAVANYSGYASVQLNTSAVPTGIHFDAPRTVNVGATTYAAATGDLNNDGKPDAVVSATDGYVHTLLGDGSGGLIDIGTTSIGSAGYDVRLADVNRDGRLDLITTGSGSGLYVAFGTGSGGFGAVASYATNASPYFIDTGDLNRDGYPDIVVSCNNSSVLSIYLNDRSGGFTSRADNNTVPYGPAGVKIDDLDGDGHCDIAVTVFSSTDFCILWGDGSGTFGSAAYYPAGSDTYAGIDSADTDRDGDRDLILGNWKGSAAGYSPVGVSTYTNPGFGLQTTTLAPGVWSLESADLSRDGRPDVLDSNGWMDEGVTALRGDGVGGFDWQHTYWQGHCAHKSALADFNLDGRLDVIAPDSLGNNVGVLLSDTTPPVTSHDADGDWHNEDVTVTFSATDEPDGWGLGKTEYSTDGGGSWTAASEFTIAADPSGANDGVHDFLVRSEDQVGNREDPPVAGQVLIDALPPATTDDVPAAWVTTDTTVDFSATDAGSGWRYTQYRVDGGVWRRGTSVMVPAPTDGSNDGIHRIEYRSVDMIMNIEETHTTWLRVGPPEVHVTTDGSDTTGVGTEAQPFLTIGHAMDLLLGDWGETIVVHSGTYGEDVVMKSGVELFGNTGTTTIVGSGAGPVVTASGLGAGVVIHGLTITGGSAVNGGGVYVSGVSSPTTVDECVVTGNTSELYGGGIFAGGSAEISVQDSTVADNVSGFTGGGMGTDGAGSIYLTGTTFARNVVYGSYGGAASLWRTNMWVAIERCRFVGNYSTQWVGAVIVGQSEHASVYDCLFADNFTSWGDMGTVCFYQMWASPTVDRCTFVGNASYGGTINSLDSPPASVNSCILRDNAPGWPEIVNANAVYSNVQGGAAGVGNIDADPFFVDPPGGDYRLSGESPCIGAGDPSFTSGWDLDNVPRPQVDHVDRLGGSSMLDMGCYERPCFTIEYSDATTWHSRVELDSFFSQATEMRFRNAGGEWSAWEPYGESRPDWPLDLSGGDGTKWIEAEYRYLDVSSNERVLRVADSIDYAAYVGDTTPPVTTVTGADADWHAEDVVLGVSATDDLSGVARDPDGLRR